MKKKYFKLSIFYFSIVFSLSILLFTHPAIAANTIIVDNDGGGDYLTIQEGIDAAVYGDTVFVRPGVYYEQVTLKNGINLIGSKPEVIPRGFRIAYIYKDDKTTADEYKDFLEYSQYSVTIVQMANIASTDFSFFDVILVGPDTGYLSQWQPIRYALAELSTSIFSELTISKYITQYNFIWSADSLAINKLDNSGKPIIGLGEGGYSYFGKLGLDIGYGKGWHGQQSSVYALNSTHQIWRTPNSIYIPTSNIVKLYNTDQDTVAIYAPTPGPGVLPLGRQSDNDEHFPLIAQDGHYLLWGYGGSPDDMTYSGKRLFLNTITSLVSPFCIIDGERKIGATVTATNLTSGQISDFTIINSDPETFGYDFPYLVLDNALVSYYPFFLNDLIVKEIITEPPPPIDPYVILDYTKDILDGTIIRNDNIFRNKDSIVSPYPTVLDPGLINIDPGLVVQLVNYGIKIDNSSIVVSNNRISDNDTGIYAYNGSLAILKNNRIDANRNYGVTCSNSDCMILNNLIIKNKSGMYFSSNDTSQLINNTISDNDQYGIYANSSDPMIKNNIVTGNPTSGIHSTSNASPDISYSDVWDNGTNYSSSSLGISSAGVGCISEDPLFVDTASEDYHLKYTEDEISPCIDSGDPDPMYNDRDGTINDMGYTGGAGGETTSFGSIQTGYLFTAIGDIPTSEIVQEDTSPIQGFANVDPNIAGWFSIPQYIDAPFGGNLRIRGLFGVEDNVKYYQLFVRRLDVPSSVPELLTDPLYKIKYKINIFNKVTSEIIKVGPNTQTTSSKTMENLYDVTRFDWWYQPDLLMIWRTANWEDGKYEITCRGYDSNLNDMAYDERKLIVVVNNQPLNVQIHHVKYDLTSPNYVTDPNIQECGIIKLTHNKENLRFIVTATHGGNYLRRYRLAYHYGTNHSGVIYNENYNKSSSTAPLWFGEEEKEINSAIDAPALEWKTCAYEFHLQAWDRRTNGEYYLGYKPFRDHYYIEICEDCGSVPPITKPTAYLSVGSDMYSVGDMATLSVRFVNPLPTDAPVFWILWFEMPEYDYLWDIHDGYYLLPANYDQSFTITLPLTLAPFAITPASYGSCLLDPYTYEIFSYTGAEFLLSP